MASNYTPEEIDRMLQQAAVEQANLGKISANTAVELEGLSDAAHAHYLNKLNEDFKDLGKSILDMERQRLAGATGMSTYNRSIESSFSLIGTVLSKIPYLGKMFKTATDAASMYAVEVNKQGDQLMAAYQKMSKVGANGADGIKGLFANMQKLGYGIEELGAMAGLINQNSKTLASLGGTVNSGVNELSSISTTIRRSDAGIRLMNLGMSVDDINQSITGYLKLQTIYGRAQKTSQDNLTTGSEKYLEQLNRWVKATGTSAEAIMDAQASAMAENAYAAKRYELETKAAMGDMDAKHYLEEMDKVLAGTINVPELQKVLIKAYGGSMNDPDVAALYTMAPDAIENMQNVKHNANDMLVLLQKSSKRHLTDYAPNYAAGFKPAVSALHELVRFEADYNKYSLDEKLQMADKEVDVRDDSTKSMTAMMIAQRNTRDSLQSFVNIGIGPATKMLNKLAGVEEDVADMLPGQVSSRPSETSFVAKALKLIGLGSVSTGPNISSGNASGVAGAPPSSAGRALPSVNKTGSSGETYFGGGNENEVLYKIREMIASVESGGNYNILVGGSSQNLTSMTLGQIYELQNKMAQGGYASTAVGKYQFINSTLAAHAKMLGLDNNTIFSPQVQDALAESLIKSVGFSSYTSGSMTKERFMYKLASQWAGLPQDATNTSRYGGVGINKEKTKITFAQALASFQYGGSIAGPVQGYKVVLHGTEAIFPLTKKKKLPLSVKGFSESLKTRAELQQERTAKLEELVVIGRRQLDLTIRVMQQKS